MLTEEYLKRLEDSLECVIEHLEGEHEGKIVADRKVFDGLWDAGSLLLQLAPHINAVVDKYKRTPEADPHMESIIEILKEQK